MTDDDSPMGAAAAGTVYSGYNMGVNNGAAYLVNSGNVLFTRSNGDAIAGSAFTMMGGTNCPVGTALYTFTYTVNSNAGAGTINIGIGSTAGVNSYVVEAGTATNYIPAGVAIDVVPEPMTIALLGLGGLFLRRRK